MLRLVEQEPGPGPRDRVRAKIVRPVAARVVLLPVLLNVIGDRGGTRPEVAVDRRLGVRVDVVEQREATHERMHVRRDPLAEQCQSGRAVAAVVVAKDLIVGPVLPDDEEDVLDRTARAQRRSGWGALGVGGNHLPVGERREATELRARGHRQDPSAAGGQHGAPRMLEQIVVAGRVRIGTARVRPGAQPLRRDPQHSSARRLNVGGVRKRRDPPDRRAGGQREDGELVRCGLGGQEPPPVSASRQRPPGSRRRPGSARRTGPCPLRIRRVSMATT